MENPRVSSLVAPVEHALQSALPTASVSPQAGILQAVDILTLDELIGFGRDDGPQPRLAEKWSADAEAPTWRLWLRPGVTFHDGRRVTASVVRDILTRDLPTRLGQAFDHVERARAVGEYEIEFSLRRPSAFLLEGLQILVQASGRPAVGTGLSRPTRQGKAKRSRCWRMRAITGAGPASTV